MKILVYAFILVCALTYSVRGGRRVTKLLAELAANKCKGLFGATDADVAAMFKFEAAASAEVKCMRACTLKKIGMITNDGHIVKEPTLKFVNAFSKGGADKVTLVEEAVTACEGIKVSEDRCVAADEYIACTKKESEARGLKFS